MTSAVTTRQKARVPVDSEAGTRYLYWWLLVAIFFEYTRPGLFVPAIEAAKLNSVIPLSLLVMTLFVPGLRPLKTIFADRYARWLVAYIALVLLSVPLADVTFYAYDVFKKTLADFFLFLIISRVAISERRLYGIFILLIMSHLFVLAMSPELILNPEVRSYVKGAPYLGDGNDLSLSLCILLPMTMALAGSTRSRVLGGIAWATFVVFIIAIIGTQSRGAALACIAVFGFLWLFSKRKGASLLGIVAVAVIVAAVGSNTYFNRMKTIADYETEGSAQGRIIAWKAGLQMALHNPVLGVGAGHFPLAYGTKYRPADSASARWKTAHSMYILVLAELGLTGFIVYCALVFGGIRASLRVRRHLLNTAKDPTSAPVLQISRLLYLLAASGIGFAVAGAFLSAAYYPHVFILTGILLAARDIAMVRARVESAEAAPAASAARLAGRASVGRYGLVSNRGLRSKAPHQNGE